MVVCQRKELIELFGFETRNKYEIQDSNGNLVFYCAEMQKGFLGFLFRQMLGHWRSFELNFFDSQKKTIWRAIHPFRFFFQRLDVYSNSGAVGSVEWHWALFRKKYSLIDLKAGRVLKINSGFLSFWTFPITIGGQEVASIKKKWSGLLKETFTDTDNFLIEFSPSLGESERQLILSAAVLIDLNHFEQKARN